MGQDRLGDHRPEQGGTDQRLFAQVRHERHVPRVDAVGVERGRGLGIQVEREGVELRGVRDARQQRVRYHKQSKAPNTHHTNPHDHCNRPGCWRSPRLGVGGGRRVAPRHHGGGAWRPAPRGRVQAARVRQSWRGHPTTAGPGWTERLRAGAGGRRSFQPAPPRLVECERMGVCVCV